MAYTKYTINLEIF